jgi:hypothetical protein
LLVTVALAVVVAGFAVAANVAADIYGLFRNPAHRSLRVFGDERVAKYLLSTRYVQANFEGVLIGSSISANWDVGRMRSLRLYNESLNGGNIVEEKAILDQLLARPGVPVVLLVVHPYLTASHEFNTVQLSTREVWGALGSQSLFDAYKAALKIRLGREPQVFDAMGTEDFGETTHKLNAHLQTMMKPGEPFEVDPVALDAYRAIVDDLHARHSPIGFVIPPTSELIFAPKRREFVRYNQSILALRRGGDRVLDFSSDEFVGLRKDTPSFADGVHLRGSAAAKLTNLIDDQLRVWISQGWLLHG